MSMGKFTNRGEGMMWREHHSRQVGGWIGRVPFPRDPCLATVVLSFISDLSSVSLSSWARRETQLHEILSFVPRALLYNH